MAKEKSPQQNSNYCFQYAAKVVCTADIPGTSQTSDAVLPGVYQTAVNIHNPGRHSVKLRKKLAVPGQITEFREGKLGPDEVSRVTCRQMAQDFGVTFIHGVEGFLVIESTHSLDVVGLYTAGKRGKQVASIDIEHVPERRMEKS